MPEIHQDPALTIPHLHHPSQGQEPGEREWGAGVLSFPGVKVLGRGRLVFVSQVSLVRPRLRQHKGVAGWPRGFLNSRQLPRDPFLMLFWWWGVGEEAPTSAGSMVRWA